MFLCGQGPVAGVADGRGDPGCPEGWWQLQGRAGSLETSPLPATEPSFLQTVFSLSAGGGTSCGAEEGHMLADRGLLWGLWVFLSSPRTGNGAKFREGQNA